MGISRAGSSLLQAFGDRVRQRRLENGLSQEKLAELSGLHRTYIGHVERGEVNLALINILRIAKSLSIDASELVEGLADELDDPRIL
ncbi:MAG: helix-turn-helix transcriptional regulator [Acidimicrobiales bacterium]|nr:helix-turn-helix transcriptional regulator [Acidimicrobiales bacterium]